MIASGLSFRARSCVQRSLQAVGLALLVLSSVTGASAEEPDAREQASARFRSALEAVDHGQLSQAARDFEAAYALSPNPVVLYNLGQTQSALGRPVEAVRALRQYLETETAPLAPEREREVRELIARNEHLIGVVVLQVTPAAREVEVDAVPVDPAARTVALAAGRHVIVARRPGYLAGSVTIEVLPEAEVAATLQLKPLADEALSSPSPPPPPPPPPAPARSDEHRSPIALAVAVGGMGVGLVTLGVGTGFLISALHLNSESKADGHCNSQGCDSTGAPLRAAAVRNGNIATGLVIAGGALVGLGLITYVVTSPRTAEHKLAAHLTLAGQPGSAVNLNLTLSL